MGPRSWAYGCGCSLFFILRNKSLFILPVKSECLAAKKTHKQITHNVFPDVLRFYAFGRSETEKQIVMTEKQIVGGLKKQLLMTEKNSQ